MYSRSRWSQSLAQLSVLFILYEIISSSQQFQIMNYILFTIHISLCDSTIWWDMFCKHQIYSRISTCFCFSLSSIRSLLLFNSVHFHVIFHFKSARARVGVCQLLAHVSPTIVHVHATYDIDGRKWIGVHLSVTVPSAIGTAATIGTPAHAVKVRQLNGGRADPAPLPPGPATAWVRSGGTLPPVATFLPAAATAHFLLVWNLRMQFQ